MLNRGWIIATWCCPHVHMLESGNRETSSLFADGSKTAVQNQQTHARLRRLTIVIPNVLAGNIECTSKCMYQIDRHKAHTL